MLSLRGTADGQSQLTNHLGVVVDGPVEAIVVPLHDIVNQLLYCVPLLPKPIEDALLIGAQHVHHMRQRIEPVNECT